MVRVHGNVFLHAAALRHCNLTSRIVHGELLALFVFRRNILGNIGKLKGFCINQAPQRVRLCQEVSVLILHKEVTLAEAALEIIGICARFHILVEIREPVHHNLPVGKHPCQSTFLQWVKAHSQRL